MSDLVVTAPSGPRSAEVLTPEALAFVADRDARFHGAATSCSPPGASGVRRSGARAPSTSCPGRPTDAATAEISRSQVWQRVHNEVRLDTGETVTHELMERLVAEEHAVLGGTVDDDARRLFVQCALDEDHPHFLTVRAYDVLLAGDD